MLSGMQYYATVGTKEKAGVKCQMSLNDVKWLTKELIEEKSCSDQSLDVVESFCSKGEAAGSVVAGKIFFFLNLVGTTTVCFFR